MAPLDADLEGRVARAAAVLREGGLVAFPTETVYGLGADATDADAVERIFAAKGRPRHHPLIVHLAASAPLAPWVQEVPDTARRLAEAFWPGPLTLLLPRSSVVADAVTAGRPNVGIRVPDHPVAQRLLEVFGGGVAAPSANRYGRVSPTTAADVRAELGDAVDEVLDGGPCRVGVESTIVDLSGPVPEVLRPGGITMAQLQDVLGVAPVRWGSDGPAARVEAAEAPRAPGMQDSHYAPAARVEVLADDAPDASIVSRADVLGSDGTRVGVLAPRPVPGLGADAVVLPPPSTPEEYATVLYRRLREADELGVGHLLVVPPPAGGIGDAVRDRLRRAAG